MLVKDPPFPHPVRRLIYNGVPLVPVDPAGKGHVWHLPDGRTASTQELRDKARKERVWCVLFERYAIGESSNE